MTDECNLRCTQCYYKPWLKRGYAEMDTPVMLALLTEFVSLGARKLSLLGGEPTLYGRASGNLPLPAVVKHGRKLGFEYIRLVTNGLYTKGLIDSGILDDLDEVTFSIDGDTPEIHDHLRGAGTFRRTMHNLRKAVAAGHQVQITTCVHRGNIGRTKDGQLLLTRAIEWAQAEGAAVINFHPLFKMDIPRDSWSGDTDIDPKEWAEAYNEVRAQVDAQRFKIAVRIPQRFVTASEFVERPKHFGFCPVKMAERIEVHPNGQIHSCALNNGTPIALARFQRHEGSVRIRWASSHNELEKFPFNLDQDHPCAVMSRDFGDLAPLCISFKPQQDEFAWNSHGLT